MEFIIYFWSNVWYRFFFLPIYNILIEYLFIINKYYVNLNKRTKNKTRAKNDKCKYILIIKSNISLDKQQHYSIRGDGNHPMI